MLGEPRAVLVCEVSGMFAYGSRCLRLSVRLNDMSGRSVSLIDLPSQVCELDCQSPSTIKRWADSIVGFEYPIQLYLCYEHPTKTVQGA